MRNPDEYDGEPVCPRCGSGWPTCAELVPLDASQSERHDAHVRACARYKTMDDVCDQCRVEMDREPVD